MRERLVVVRGGVGLRLVLLVPFFVFYQVHFGTVFTFTMMERLTVDVQSGVIPQ